MSKTPQTADPYVATIYVTADQIVQHFGETNVASLPTAEQNRYNNYATMANNETETAIYKFVDELPLDTKDEVRTYAETMAFHYALWLKAADDGGTNVNSLKSVWESARDSIEKTLKAQPKAATTRTMVSQGYGPAVPPYSQTYGLDEIL